MVLLFNHSMALSNQLIRGFISRPTMKTLLKEIADDLSDAELDGAIDEIDEDGSGKIEFEEFFELMSASDHVIPITPYHEADAHRMIARLASRQEPPLSFSDQRLQQMDQIAAAVVAWGSSRPVIWAAIVTALRLLSAVSGASRRARARSRSYNLAEGPRRICRSALARDASGPQFRFNPSRRYSVLRLMPSLRAAWTTLPPHAASAWRIALVVMSLSSPAAVGAADCGFAVAATDGTRR